MKIKVLSWIILVFIIVNIVDARTHTDPPDESISYLIEKWNYLPFKDQRADLDWVNDVNDNLDPVNYPWKITGYDENEKKTAEKCLSYAASTTNDWFNLIMGIPLNSFQNFVNNQSENGSNPRELESIYHSKPNFKRIYRYALIKKDGVTREEIPYNTEGYADILTNPPSNWINVEDPEINSFKYTLNVEEYLTDFKYRGITITHEDPLKRALKRYGIIYIHADIPYTNVPLHALSLIGYNDTHIPFLPLMKFTEFWYHDSYNGEDKTDFSRYGTITVGEIHNGWTFWDPQWSTYHHDNRRTGFTTLKGDISSVNDIKKSDYKIDNNPLEGYDRPSVADIDGDGNMNIIITTAKNELPKNGTIYNLEWNGFWFAERWKTSIDYPVRAAPSLGDIDGDGNKEIVFGLENMSFMVLDDDGDVKWTINGSERYSAITNDTEAGKFDYSAIADLDHDGNKEIIFQDFISTSLYDWPAVLFILNDDGSTYSDVDYQEIGDGGAWSAVSIANIDGDDNLEVIVPTTYALKVYDFDNGQLTQKYSKSDAMLMGSVVIYDIDYDDEYELIYTTSDKNCPGGKSCGDQLHVRDAETGDYESGYPINLSIVSRVTPAVADIDGDGIVEIIIVGENSVSTTLGKVYCYKYTTRATCTGFPYSDNNNLEPLPASPNIVDINGDGNYDILIGTRNDEVIVIESDGSVLLNYDYGSELGSVPIIADIKNKGVAEIVTKISGSNVLSLLSGKNEKPILNQISNFTIDENELFNINDTEEVIAKDSNVNDTLTFYYSSPLNDTGYWKPSCSDSGNYSILVEVSDGNLSDWQYINLGVLESCTDAEFILKNMTNQSALFKFEIFNNEATAENITWVLQTGEDNLTNDETIILEPDESIINYVRYTYSQTANYSLELNINNQTYKYLDVEVQ